MIQNIEVSKLRPHPRNPRKDLGDLTELAESIKVSGVLQNLTVVPQAPGHCTSCSLFFGGQHCEGGHDKHERPPCSKWKSKGNYTVVIGHRRLAAAKKAGLTEVPCAISSMDEKTQISTMMVENMQRNDLSIYEQAQGFQMMLDFGDSISDIAEKTGFSDTTVRRRVKMMELDQGTLKEVSKRQLSLSDFDRLAQIEDIGARNECLKEIGTSNFEQNVATQFRRQTIKKNLPVVKKLLKQAKAKAIKQSDAWGCKYDNIACLSLEEWKDGDPLIPEKASGQVFYFLDEKYGNLSFYGTRKRAAPVKKSAEEVERQKRLDAAWERAKEQSDVAYKLRSDFVKGISLNSKNMTAMLKGALSSTIFRNVDYSGPDRELLTSTLGVDDSGYDPKRGAKAMLAFEAMSAQKYPILIYANFGDGKDLSYAKGYKGEWPKHEQDSRLDALYTWLCSLGYVMSDEERAMQDGTHELFSEDEK